MSAYNLFAVFGFALQTLNKTVSKALTHGRVNSTLLTVELYVIIPVFFI